MKFKKVCPAEIVDLIRKNEYYCLEELKFNSDTKFLLYGLEVLVVEMEAINFSLHFEVNAPVKSFYEAVYALSLLNPASSQDKIQSYKLRILRWLDKNAVDEIINVCVQEQVFKDLGRYHDNFRHHFIPV